MSVLLQLEHVTTGYGSKVIVRDVNLEIREGEFCALLGLNGSGKTTLLKAVCGLIPVREGRCLVGGLDCTRFHERKRAQKISYIPQRHSKMQGVSVLDAVLMGCNPHLGLLDSPDAGDRALAIEALAKMGLEELADKDFSRLSGGQKQLVILARTLLQNAPVMLMDEPDSALDFCNRHRMLSRVQELIHSERKAGLITIHDPNFALAYCDRLVLLRDGAIIDQVRLADAGRDEILACLSKIYGEIILLEHNEKYILVQQ